MPPDQQPVPVSEIVDLHLIFKWQGDYCVVYAEEPRLVFHQPRHGQTRPCFHWQLPPDGSYAPAGLNEEDEILWCKKNWPMEIFWGNTHDPNIGVHFDDWPHGRFNYWNKQVESYSRPGVGGKRISLVSNYSRWTSQPQHKPVDPEEVLRTAQKLDAEGKLTGVSAVPTQEPPGLSVPVDIKKIQKAAVVVFNPTYAPRSPELEQQVRQHPRYPGFVLVFRKASGDSMENDNTVIKQYQRALEHIETVTTLSEYPDFDVAYDRWLREHPGVALPHGWYAPIALDKTGPRLYQLGTRTADDAEAAFERLRQQKSDEAARQASYRGVSQKQARRRVNDAFDRVPTFHTVTVVFDSISSKPSAPSLRE